MLNLCKAAHEEIAYTVALCPCCMIVNHFREKLADLDSKLTEAKEYIEILREESDHGQESSVAIH